MHEKANVTNFSIENIIKKIDSREVATICNKLIFNNISNAGFVLNYLNILLKSSSQILVNEGMHMLCGCLRYYLGMHELGNFEHIYRETKGCIGIISKIEAIKSWEKEILQYDTLYDVLQAAHSIYDLIKAITKNIISADTSKRLSKLEGYQTYLFSIIHLVNPIQNFETDYSKIKDHIMVHQSSDSLPKNERFYQKSIFLPPESLFQCHHCQRKRNSI
jgi:hypothetical protein